MLLFIPVEILNKITMSKRVTIDKKCLLSSMYSNLCYSPDPEDSLAKKVKTTFHVDLSSAFFCRPLEKVGTIHLLVLGILLLNAFTGSINVEGLL
mmetsp:Transcript_8649/g.11225  ORF Transcript_8649/g.11225 Transcript_8649/m.11225 type:complete len:95 (+) Transcript_8649:360-644(+)